MNGIEEKEVTRISMENILEDISNLEVTSKDYKGSIKAVSDELIEYYKENGRHQYSEVSAFLINIEEQDLDYILENLESIKANIQEYDIENSSNFYEKVLKLEDHIKLESLRIDQLNQSKDLSNEINVKVSDFKNDVREYEDKLNYMTKNINGLNSQIISIIGIFSAIVITFFGGINFIEGVINSIGEVSKYRFVFSIFITGFVMFNTIFMLLNSIAKLTGKNIRSKCKHMNDGICSYECDKFILNCIKQKHPTIFWVNLNFIIGMIVITILYYLKW